MSSDEPVRSVPDELFQQVTARPERQLPDALFGPAPAAPKRAEREEPIRTVPDELFKQATARATRSLPDALFGPVPPPVDTTTAATEPGSDAPDAEPSVENTVPEQDSTELDAPADDVRPAPAEPLSVDIVAAEQMPAVPDDRVPDAHETVTGTVPSGETAAVPAAPDAVAADPSTGSATGPAVSTEADVSEVGDTDGEPVSDVVAADLGSATAPVPAETAVPELIAPESADISQTPDPVAPESAESAEIAPATEPVETLLPDAEPVPSPATVGSTDSSSGPVVEPLTTEAVPPASVAGAPVAVEPEPATPRPVLLVIADSLSYFGPKGGLPADDPRIWPNLVAAELDWDVELVARIGWTCRDGYWALIGDPRVWAAVPRAGAVVFAVGGMDTLPSPLPTALRELIRYVRPPRLRRGVRATYNWLQPKLSKLGRPVALPPRVSVGYLEDSREALAQLRPELPIIGVLPSVHKCDAYGRVHRGRPRAVKALRAWSERTSVPLVDLGEAVRDDIESGDANPDGIHWGWAGHQAVATAMTKTLQENR